MKFSARALARMSGALALAFGMLAMLLSAQSGVAQNGNSSIEVHNRVCPTDYQGTDYFDDCHDNTLGPGYEFTFTNEDTGESLVRATNEAGDVGLANLDEGTYTIVGGPPAGVTDAFAYCAVGTAAEPGQEQVPVDYINGAIQLYLPADTNVICDWYTIPMSQNGVEPGRGDSSLEIHNRICPVEYEGTDFFEDCHDTIPDPGLPFTFINEDTGETYDGATNEEGNVGLANLNEGTYTIIGGAPGEFAEHVVYCSVGAAEVSDQEQIDFEYVRGGIQLYLPAATNVICDWYDVPYDLQGEPTATQPSDNGFDLPVYKLLCDSAPAEQALGDFVMVGTVPDACEQHPGTLVTVTDAAGAELGSCVTEAANPCFVTVPVGTAVYGTEDLGTVPEGYLPLDGETIELTIEPASEASLLLVNVAEQPAPNQFDLPIYTLLCESDPGPAASDFVMGGIVPDGCEPYIGATVTITAPDGSTLGTCETAGVEPCYVTVEIGTTVTATLNTATLPADYRLVAGETQDIEIPPASEAWVHYVAVPAVQTPAPEAPDPAPLPEGRMVSIHEGSCEPEEPGATVVELTGLRGPDLDTDTDVIVAETSSTLIDLSIEELMASEHAVIAWSDDDTQAPVACTVIGGQQNDAGELVLGMQAVSDSGYAGIVYIAETDDGTQTGISVFLAEGLADDEPTTLSRLAG
jgi:hypothetical protein